MSERSDTNSVDAVLIGRYRCEVTARSHRIPVDEPTAVGGDDTGPQPTELLLASLASCYAMALSHVAAKRSIDLGTVEVKATGTYDGPSFSELAIEVTVGGDHERIDDLLERARAVCYVSNTLARTPPITVTRTGPGAPA